MAAAKANYVIVYKNTAQVYAASSLKTAVNTPLPKGAEPEDKVILFISYLPDTTELRMYPLTKEQIAEITNEPDEEKEQVNVE